MDQVTVYVEAFKCGVAGWNVIWGDPLLSGTIFMVGYALAAALILRTATLMQGRERRLWQLCGLLFVFQMLNVHLDLHAFPGTFGRCLAHAQGWYANRREVQLAFLIAVATAGLLITLLAIALFYRNLVGNLLLVSGVGIALGITVVKGINYHGAERLYGGSFGPFRTADLIELGGITIALVAALIRHSLKPFTENRSHSNPAGPGINDV